MTNKNLDKTVTTIKELIEDINKTEDSLLTSIYGKTYVEGAQRYIEEHPDYSFTTLVDAEFIRCSKFNDNDHSIINDKYNHDRKEAFLSGCIYGSLNKDMYLDTDDIEVKGLVDDFIIMYPFNDNDFGYGIEEAGNAYTSEFNKRYKHIKYLKSNDFDTESYVKKIKELEDANIIKNIICSAYVSSRTNINSVNYEYCSSIEKTLNEIKSEMEYLGIENKDNYIIGSENAIRKILLEKYACDGMKDDTPLNKIDCNHEVLIIQVKDSNCSSAII